jgi:hypothetical protein
VAYGELIKEAFRIALRNRYLWFFGLFSGATSGPSFNFQFRGSADTGSLDVDPALIAGIVLGALVLFVVFAVLSVIAQGALVDSVTAIQRGERRGFGTAWSAGRASFWRVLRFGLLVLGIAFVLALAIGLPLGGMVVAAFALTDATALRLLVGLGAAMVAIVALMLVFLPLVVIAQLALREVLLGGKRAADALRAGFRLLRSNLGPALLLFLIQQGLAVGASIVVVVAALLASLPAIVLLVAGSGVAAAVVAIVTALIVLPLTLAAFGAIGAFSHAFWTLGYLRLARPAG